MTQNQFEITQSHLDAGNHIGNAFCTMLCTERVVLFRSNFSVSVFLQVYKTQSWVKKSSGFGEIEFVIMVLACVTVYSKRNICMCI